MFWARKIYRMSPVVPDLLKSRFLAGSLKNLVIAILSIVVLITLLAIGICIVEDKNTRIALISCIPFLCGAMFWTMGKAYKTLNQKYAQLKEFILSFNTPEATIITTENGKIEWKSPSFLKSFADFENIKTIEELFIQISTVEERAHLLGACKNLNAQNPDFDKTVWLQEEPLTQRILVKARYLAHNKTTVWTWIKLDSIQKILLEDFLISDSSEDFLRSVQFKDLYDAAPAGDVLLDSEGSIIHYNHSFEQKFLQKELTINATANFKMLQVLFPLLKHSEAARVVFAVDGSQINSQPYWGSYAISQQILASLVQLYHQENPESSVKVNLFDTGPFASGLRSKAFPGEDSTRHAKPMEIAQELVQLLHKDFCGSGNIVRFKNSHQHKDFSLSAKSDGLVHQKD